ncbi:adenylate/guanylate cyclase domain-containing protein [Thermodesulfobacteriota bacterium]
MMNANWLSSKEILLKTNISRATLNNYIKMGILPRPDVRKLEGDQKGPRQIGFFPETVLDTIETVKRMKNEGLSMEEIVKKIDDLDAPSKGTFQDEGTLLHGPSIEEPEVVESDALRLTLEDLSTPAYLINRNFEVEWINREAEEKIFKTEVRSIPQLELRNIFKLFFNWEFSSYIKNWKEVVDFHMQVVKSGLQKSLISHLYEGITAKECRFLQEIYDQVVPFPEKSINKSPMSFSIHEEPTEYYNIYTLFFREGIFFLYLPSESESQEIIELLSRRGKLIDDLLKRQLPSLVSLCVLVADLQDSVKISSELMPGEYFSLINELWKTMSDTFEKYNGICGKHAGDGMLHYFIKKPGSNYLMDAIQCAMELREKTKIFSREMKMKKGWLNDLYLNIGINEGQEFFGSIRSSSNIEFTALGDSINYAGRLSDFARCGKIWTTKNVIIKLNQEELNTIRFGVYRKEDGREIFVENSFLRVIDFLEQNNGERNKFSDIATLPITEILGEAEIQKSGEGLSPYPE